VAGDAADPRGRALLGLAPDQRPRSQAWTEWAVNLGAEFVIVDHIDRIDHGEGKNSFHEVSETVRLAKELAVEHGIVMLVASQSVDRRTPRSVHAAGAAQPARRRHEGGGSRHGARYLPTTARRRRREGDQARAARARERGHDHRANQMGVRVLKHRLDGGAMGRSVRLEVYHGRVLDLEERHTYTTQYGARGQV
jgi:hypothetical protein